MCSYETMIRIYVYVREHVTYPTHTDLHVQILTSLAARLPPPHCSWNQSTWNVPSALINYTRDWVTYVIADKNGVELKEPLTVL